MRTLWLAPLTLVAALLLPGAQASEQPAPSLEQLKVQAHAGEASAQRQLALAYLEGLGVNKDAGRAYELFVAAARQQDAEAQFYLGQAYLKGKGTDRNLISAYIWLSASAGKDSALQAEAIAQRDQVAGMLTDAQREKAKLLVEQLEQLYLP